MFSSESLDGIKDGLEAEDNGVLFMDENDIGGK